jgi:hypothetical protein
MKRQEIRHFLFDSWCRCYQFTQRLIEENVRGTGGGGISYLCRLVVRLIFHLSYLSENEVSVVTGLAGDSVEVSTPTGVQPIGFAEGGV